MPPDCKQTIQDLCLEAVRHCGLNAHEIIRFVEARISEMNEEDRAALERNVQLLLSFEPEGRPPQ